MSWLDVVHGGEGLMAVYGDQVPELRSVTVQGVLLHRSGPRVDLGIELPDYPAVPPRKWAAQGFNTVQFTLMLVDVQDVSLSGWGTEVVGDIALTRTGHRVDAALTSATTRFTCTASAVYVDKLSAYLRVPEGD